MSSTGGGPVVTSARSERRRPPADTVCGRSVLAVGGMTRERKLTTNALVPSCRNSPGLSVFRGEHERFHAPVVRAQSTLRHTDT
ncbi:hypothetical protein D8S78_02760 [Natrialba swarupiae]|nr:hypothetical protein [Natrialba swarupiae]